MEDVVVVGGGAWGANLVRTFRRLGALRWVCDLNPAVIERVRAEFPGVRVSRDLGEALADDAVTGVAVATPPASHYAVARGALESGRHVFVEKPLTLDVAEGEALVQMARERRRHLVVGHLLLYHPATQKLKTLIETGDLGEVHYIYSNRLNLGTIRRGENVLWSLAPHDISVMLYLLDGPPAEVSCTGMPYVQPDVEDVAFCTLRFESGVLGHVHVSWLDPHKVRKFTVVGSRRMVVFDDMESSEKVKIFDKGAVVEPGYASYGEAIQLRFGDIVTPFLKVEEPLKIECAHFLDVIRNGTLPLTPGKDGLAVLRVLVAAERSLKGGGVWVRMERKEVM